MPVAGTHVVQYRWRPSPYPVLDRDFDRLDRNWRHLTIDRLRRGQAAVDSLSVYEAFPSESGATYHGWEATEKHAAKAIRTGSAYLTDEQIAARLPRRKLLKEAMAEMLAENKAKAEKAWAAQEAEQAEMRKAEQAYYAKQRENERRRFVQETEWEREQILRARFKCSKCGARGQVVINGEDYAVECTACDQKAFCTHAELLRVINA